MTVINPNSISGITSITMPSGDGNVLTIHTNDGTERFRIDSSGNVKVGSACTISQDGDVFFTGVTTATTFTGAHSGSGANLTSLPAAQLTGALPAISGANLTGIAATDNVRTGILDVAGIATFRNDVNIGAAVTISESGIEASGIGITVANINGTQIGGRRNKIINGGMTVSQRHTTTTNSNAFVVDRFQAQVTQMDELAQTLEQSSNAPDGFSRSIKITTTTPESSIASNEQFRIQTKLEGQDFQDLAYGTSAAKTITISFYVKASVTGTFGFTVYRNESTARVITAPYTISSADTWERKIITIPGDTAGAAITNDNTERFRLMWGLAAGGNFNTPSSSWGNYSSANLLGGHNTNTLVTTDNATWQLTGVQLEVGSQATPFEHRNFNEEHRTCMRYFEKSFEYAVAPANSGSGSSLLTNDGMYVGLSHNNSFRSSERWKVEKRADPTWTAYGNSSGEWYSTSTGYAGNNSGVSYDKIGFRPRQQQSGSAIYVEGHWTADAEL